MIELVGQLIDVYNFINIVFLEPKKISYNTNNSFEESLADPYIQHHLKPYVYPFPSRRPNYSTLYPY